MRASHLAPLAGAALLLAGWAQIGWNATAGSAVPALHMRVKVPLGTVVQPLPEWSLHSLASGEWQRAAALRVGPLSSAYQGAVRLRNSFYYAALGMSAVPTILVGRDGQLLERGYVEEYCSRDLAALRPRAEAWATRMRALQDRVEARGQVFRYVLTPSKPAYQPGWIPQGTPCPGLADAPGKRVVLRDAFARAGVHAVDTAAALDRARAAYPFELFPKGGTHWNQVGAAVATQALAASLNGTRAALVPFRFRVTGMSWQPEGTDRDLASILNFLPGTIRYAVPQIAVDRAGDGGCRPVRLAWVAGSFSMNINAALQRTACPPVGQTYFYWDMWHFTFEDGSRPRQEPVDPAQRAQALADADAVIVEENERQAPESVHAAALMQAMGVP